MKEKKKSAVSWILEWAGQKRSAYVWSVVLAVGNVIFKIIPYFIIANVITMFLDGSNEFKEYFNIMVFEMISTTIDKDIFNIHSKYSKKEKIIQLKKFIEQDFCNTAIINLNTKFLNKNQKLLYRLLKIKCYTVIYYLYMIKQKTKKRKIVR